MQHVTSAKYLSGYKIWVAFDDDTSGKVGLECVLKGSVFEPLKDIGTFQQLAVDPELETVVWPNGVDLALEFLKELQLKQSQAVQ
ncbi:DUF2442 domain-containing protein [Oceanospirillum linum]|uniref:DUF2442 domain-containing protein n=1 Tax=Oceanospirillum linum TaxID=966 RepID=A0A1T1HAJ3_OCELI|nr:DUF2442 domain-containing protein [Oceanospirillum linum]OOV86879.1 hypothetical protein BTA35_0211320 [Oceanospirillum linum]SEG20097.1 Protein of unknown function [Oleiphilus messinensis]SMP24354.1 Protein of unknown function [Oceanospirillum linum]